MTNRRSTISANIKENILHITLKGTVTKKEAERIYTDIRFCVADLQPGFNVITDLTNCRIGHLAAMSVSRKIVEFLVSRKVGKVVRVAGPSRIILLQMAQLIHKEKGYEPIYANSMEEAENLLAEGKKEKTG